MELKDTLFLSGTDGCFFVCTVVSFLASLFAEQKWTHDRTNTRNYPTTMICREMEQWAPKPRQDRESKPPQPSIFPYLYTHYK